MNIGQVFSQFGAQIDTGVVCILATIFIPRVVGWVKAALNKEIDVIETAGLSVLKNSLDPEWLNIVSLVIAKLQKEADSPDFLAKITALKQTVKTAIPGTLDDPVIDAIFDTIYNRLKGK